jgi:hypothetical protein
MRYPTTVFKFGLHKGFPMMYYTYGGVGSHLHMKGMKEHYDMGNYSKESGLYDRENKKVGKFKDESPD